MMQTTNPSGSIRVKKSVERLSVGTFGAVVVQMIGFDIRHDGGVRPIDQEGTVALVGLRDEVLASTINSIGAGLP